MDASKLTTLEARWRAARREERTCTAPNGSPLRAERRAHDRACWDAQGVAREVDRAAAEFLAAHGFTAGGARRKGR